MSRSNHTGPNRRSFIINSLAAAGAVTVDGTMLFKLFNPVVAAASTGSGTIVTVAGGGPLGDGGVATDANLSTPFSTAVDMTGNLFIADLYFHRIRKADAVTKIMSTVAGSGVPTFSGDGGPAVNAGLFMPYGVVPDSAGNLYIADNGNSCVRRVAAATGIITTFVGIGGRSGYNGDGLAAAKAQLSFPRGVALDKVGNLYIADTLNSRVRVVNMGTQPLTLYAGGSSPLIVQPGSIATVAGNGTFGGAGDEGPATSAQLRLPTAITLDTHGKLYIADLYNQRVRAVDATTGTITTVAGNGTSGFSGDGGPATGAELADPTGVALDSAGNLYIAQMGSPRIRKVDARSQTISTVAGWYFPAFLGDNGPATKALLNVPTGVTIDAADNLFIADQNNARVRRVDHTTQAIATVAGSSRVADLGASTGAVLVEPAGLAFDAHGNLYIADQGNQRIRVVGVHGVIETVAGSGVSGFGGDGGVATAAHLNQPDDVKVDTAGNLYVADLVNNRIRFVSAQTGIITTVVGTGKPGYGGDNGPAGAAQINAPRAIALNTSLGLYIADFANVRVRFVNTGSQPVTLYAGSPNALTVPPGQIITVVGTGVVGSNGDYGPAIQATLTSPRGVAVDRPGNLFVTEGSFDIQGADLTRADSRIRMVNAQTGIITTVAGTDLVGYNGDNIPATSARLFGPRGVAIDSAGNLYIADTYNQRIRFVNRGSQPVTLMGSSANPITVPGGYIVTVAGTGVVGFSGDGGSALAATMLYPRYVALDSTSTLLYVTDMGNSRIRRVALQ